MELPTHAPFDAAQKDQLSRILASLTAEQTAWLSGYLAGVHGSAAASPVVERKLTVLYGTESGNSEELADQAFKAAKQRGFKASLLNMADTEPGALKEAGHLLVVVSTWGDGEPPEAAEEFYQSLMEGEHDFSGLSYSVCALGDSGYDQFCQTGKDVDERLAALGAERIVERVDCDVDFDDDFATWSEAVWAQLGQAEAAAVALSSPASGAGYDKKNPFPAEILENQLLSGDHSGKETIHVELSLEGSGLNYQPGDVLAVLPRNAEDVVSVLIESSGLSADARVELKDVGEKSLSDALTVDLDITDLSRKVAESWQELAQSSELASLLDEAEVFKTWAEGRQIVDLIEQFPVASLEPQLLVDCLRKLPARLYSIASSPKAHPGEVHLTVAVVRYETHDKSRKGVASTFLADDAPKGSLVSVYVHHNKNFRLPEQADTPVIMVGPGTGVAPFRAFVEERSANGSTGDNWLFFGDQCYNEDFLYQLEWQEHLKSGGLKRLDVAFSRDQPEKVYVQHQIEKRAGEVWSWLEKGAHFYVCGDASRMAKDVHDSLLAVVREQGGYSEQAALDYVSNLKKEKRYQRDVY